MGLFERTVNLGIRALLVGTGIVLLVPVTLYAASRGCAALVFNGVLNLFYMTPQSIPWFVLSLCSITDGGALILLGGIFNRVRLESLSGFRNSSFSPDPEDVHRTLNALGTTVVLLAKVTVYIVLIGLAYALISYLVFLASAWVLFGLLLLLTVYSGLARSISGIKQIHRLIYKVRPRIRRHLQVPEYTGVLTAIAILVAVILNFLIIVQY